MSNPWWAAVALLVFMTFHFAWITRRDKSIEKRFSAQFEAVIAMEHVRAEADIAQARALTGLESEIRHLVSAAKYFKGEEPPGKGANHVE